MSNEIKEMISNSNYVSIENELTKLWYKNYNEFSAWMCQLEEHIRYFKPLNWTSKISDFDFPEMKPNQYVWLFYGGDVNSCGLPYYKIEAYNDFIKSQSIKPN